MGENGIFFFLIVFDLILLIIKKPHGLIMGENGIFFFLIVFDLILLIIFRLQENALKNTQFLSDPTIYSGVTHLDCL